jgi:hypothetical protein
MGSAQTWFAFECRCGIVADVRLDGEPRDPPVVLCPICPGAGLDGEVMWFKGRWLADADGYGSRADSGCELARAALPCMSADTKEKP